MQRVIGIIKTSEFLRHNALAFAGSITVAALNYLYYPVLGRVMGAADFGEAQAVNSLLLQIVIFLGVFNFVIVGVITKYPEQDTQNRLIAELEKVAAIIAGLIIAGLLLFTPQITAFFRFQSIYPFLGLLIALCLAVPGAFRTAYLQGKKDFAAAAKAGAISSGGKLILSFIFVLLGWRAFGAIIGMVIAQGLAILYIVPLVRRHGWLRPEDFRRVSLPDLGLIRPELAFAVLVLVTTFSLNVFLSMDILAVKHWFDPVTAGLYGGIETLGRIVFFINGSVAGVLLPSVKPGRAAGENRPLLYRSLALAAALGLGVLIVFVAAPRLVVILLMGHKFLPYAGLLPRLGLLAFLASLINLIFNYYLAQRRLFIGVAAVLGLAGTLIILNIHHDTPAHVVNSLIAGAGLLLAFTGALRLAVSFRSRSSALVIRTKNSPNISQ